MPNIGDGTLRVINLVPFYGTLAGSFNSIPEMRFNILVFLPFGFYLSALAPKCNRFKQALLIFCASAFLEALQYVLAIGRSDVTDLILNTLGGAAGIAVYSMLSRLFGKYSKGAMRIICVMITVLELALTIAISAVFTRFT